MIESAFLISILVFFILAFGVKNILTILKEKQSIKGKSKKLSLSVLISTSIYILLLVRLIFGSKEWFYELSLPLHNYIKIGGYCFVIIGFLVGVLALIEMKSSWRVGIKHNQKTTLITSGIYGVSRNPYFLSYGILIIGYLLFFPSIIILILLVSLLFVFHKMILEEEQYLEKVQGKKYLKYKGKVNRYIGLKNNRD